MIVYVSEFFGCLFIYIAGAGVFSLFQPCFVALHLFNVALHLFNVAAMFYLSDHRKHI